MSLVERPLTQPTTHHLNPHLIEWALPEEKVAIHLLINQPEMAELPCGSREQLTLALSRMGMLSDYIIANEEALGAKGVSVEAAFSFLAQNIKDVTTLFQMMTGELVPTEGKRSPF